MFKEKIGCAAMTVLIVLLTSVSVVGCAALGDWLAGECSVRCERAKEVRK
jgi:hypothetical protein